MSSKKVHVIGTDDDIDVDNIASQVVHQDNLPPGQFDSGYIPNQVVGINALGRLIKFLVLRRITAGGELDIYHMVDSKSRLVAELTRNGIIVSKTNTRVTYENLRDEGRSWAISQVLESLVDEIEMEFEDSSSEELPPNEPPIRGVNALGRLIKILVHRRLGMGGEREIYRTNEETGKPELVAELTRGGIILADTGMRVKLETVRDNGRFPGLEASLESLIAEIEENGLSFDGIKPIQEGPRKHLRAPKMAGAFPDKAK